MKASTRAFCQRPDSPRMGRDRTVIHGASLESIFEKTGNRGENSRSLVVEIGCGVGLHPILYAREFPKKAIVAIERTSEKFERFVGRLDQHPALKRNLSAVHADAVHFIDRNFAPASIDEVWILYPNPETKKPTKRWFQAPFMHRLIELMKPGAVLYFATNLEDYARDAESLAPTLGFTRTAKRLITQASYPKWQARTHFEKKYYLRGETLFDFEFRLTDVPGASR